MTLNLAGNKLTNLPSEIGRLTNLAELNLGGDNYYHNNRTSLPSDIGQLANLTSLD